MAGIEEQRSVARRHLAGELDKLGVYGAPRGVFQHGHVEAQLLTDRAGIVHGFAQRRQILIRVVTDDEGQTPALVCRERRNLV
jgi:hypothetical protein